MIMHFVIPVPPAAPSINGFPNGSTIEVPFKADSIMLNCSSINGKPAAKLTWAKNGQPVETEADYLVCCCAI